MRLQLYHPPFDDLPGAVPPAGSIDRMRVVLYSRAGCHLCDVARDVLLSERSRSPFELMEVDVAGDDELEREYGLRIPVVEIDGEDRFECEVDPGELISIVRGG
jgi:glutaredoxin-like protein DUF836